MVTTRRGRRQPAQAARAAALPPISRASVPSLPTAEGSTPPESVMIPPSGPPDLVVSTAVIPATTPSSSADHKVLVVPWPYTILHDRHVLARGCHLRGELDEARYRFEELYEEAKIYYGCADHVTCSIGETLIEIYSAQGDMEAVTRLWRVGL